VLKDTVIGWPKGGNLPALQKGMQSIGILNANAAKTSN